MVVLGIHAAVGEGDVGRILTMGSEGDVDLAGDCVIRAAPREGDRFVALQVGVNPTGIVTVVPPEIDAPARARVYTGCVAEPVSQGEFVGEGPVNGSCRGRGSSLDAD
jgi:hypothetical protein